MSAIDSLQPQPLWNYFSQLCGVPRPSGEEAAVRQLIIDFAQSLGLQYLVDSAGNLIVKKPATAGYENRAGVVLQSHLDMVPQKNNDSNHDFSKDPISPFIDGDWVRADGTTLGADNGIGVAAIMAVLASNELQHGPVEALFTIEEESSMSGAEGLGADTLDGEILFNLDSEDEGELFVGCAGCVDIVSTAQYEEVKPEENSKSFEIFVSGLKGGHSGCDIHLGRGNANRVMARLLKRGTGELGMSISSLKGGSLRNAIPREAFANVVVPAANAERLREIAEEVKAIVQAELAAVEGDLSISVKEVTPLNLVMPQATQRDWLALLACCPIGVQRMSDSVPGVVETSNNLAVVHIANGNIKVECMARSAVDSAMDELAETIRDAFALTGAESRFEAPSPGWTPNMNSPILGVMRKTYQRLFDQDPEIKVIHAGLECGLLGGTYPRWDMISFGPTIRFPHSPDEKVEIKTVDRFWQLLSAALREVPESRSN
ncbi:aminoacyl-histidine dipeptidase [Aestuariirhabdus sp. Z084]|uniref:aminoacyl-histidine dipeptidase n=1 Tax=Aestuariirhabdus haliotis TaxID=2918751 RepID=UPI00201B43BC|nr:aminoacyl-histidine dipeptidase [Aestuariirhabdus haliotis]MCL6414858.1 aminoacyl-histidine dipeptidase [Aestuariirhabdus haliotis]MCL6418790.1 aminoacyl-histidine dipeptidase [Aestuariirhabdus haliotis]